MSAGFVRPATAADAAAIVATALSAWPAAGDSVDADSLTNQWHSLLQDPEPAAVFVATSADVVVGWLLLTPASDPDLAGLAAWEVADVVVHPSQRRGGHGSRLMHAAVDVALTRGGVLTAWCPVHDEARRAFFTSHGLGPDGAWRDLAAETGETMREVRLVATVDAADETGAAS